MKVDRVSIALFWFDSSFKVEFFAQFSLNFHTVYAPEVAVATKAKCRSNRALSAINKRFQFYVKKKKKSCLRKTPYVLTFNKCLKNKIKISNSLIGRSVLYAFIIRVLEFQHWVWRWPRVFFIAISRLAFSFHWGHTEGMTERLWVKIVLSCYQANRDSLIASICIFLTSD